MIKAVEGRYGHTKARVSYINQFEEAGQKRGEDTRAFLSRLQQVASEAFPKLSDDSRRERVLSSVLRKNSAHRTIPHQEKPVLVTVTRLIVVKKTPPALVVHAESR